MPPVCISFIISVLHIVHMDKFDKLPRNLLVRCKSDRNNDDGNGKRSKKRFCCHIDGKIPFHYVHPVLMALHLCIAFKTFAHCGRLQLDVCSTVGECCRCIEYLCCRVPIFIHPSRLHLLPSFCNRIRSALFSFILIICYKNVRLTWMPYKNGNSNIV